MAHGVIKSLGHFAPTARHGTPQEFKRFVDRCTKPASACSWTGCRRIFRKTRTVLREFDGTALYEHADPRRGEHVEWGTKIFNYGRHEVRNFLIANALFWLEQYHIDGLRVDAVASMLYLDYAPQARRVGAESVRRSRESRSDRVPEAAQLDGRSLLPGRADDGRRVDLICRCDAARCISADSGFISSGTWAG